MHQFVQTEHRLCDITTCSANPNGRPTTKEVLERELVICLPCHKLGGSADRVSLSMGAPLGEPGEEGGLLVGDPKAYERRALGMGTSLYGGSVGTTWGGLIYWDFNIWLKGLWRWSVSLHGSSVKGT